MTVLTDAARLLGFTVLAVITNTAFPYPFEPVLLVFAEGANSTDVITLSAIASIAAGVAAIIDYHVFGALRDRMFARGVRDFHRWWFYAGVFATALLPIPYTVARAALLRGRPKAVLFAATVMLARFPRYLLTIHVWHVVSPPPWVTVALVILGAVVAVYALRNRRRTRRIASGDNRDEFEGRGEYHENPTVSFRDHSLRKAMRGSIVVARNAGT